MDRIKAKTAPVLMLFFWSTFTFAATDKEMADKPEHQTGAHWYWKEDNAGEAAACLTPSQPGCSAMWHQEKQQENEQRLERRREKQLYRQPASPDVRLRQ